MPSGSTRPISSRETRRGTKPWESRTCCRVSMRASLSPATRPTCGRSLGQRLRRENRPKHGRPGSQSSFVRYLVMHRVAYNNGVNQTSGIPLSIDSGLNTPGRLCVTGPLIPGPRHKWSRFWFKQSFTRLGTSAPQPVPHGACGTWVSGCCSRGQYCRAFTLECGTSWRGWP
jgi:hypothetical protein